MTTTSIEWTRNPDGTAGKTWNFIRAENLTTKGVGHYCEKISPGCANCYAERMQKRFRNFIRYNAADRGKVRLYLDRNVLSEPLRWRKPGNVFPCSMTDLFGGFVPDEWLDSAFAVMALTPHVTYQVLTKRIDRARAYLSARECRDAVGQAAYDEHGVMFTGDPACASDEFRYLEWPLPNVWIVASVENQDEADRRVPELLKTPAAVRGLSCEPLLGPLDLTDINPARDETPDHLDALRGVVRTSYPTKPTGAKLDWVIVGGESGAGARPMHPRWARSLRDQCTAAGTPFFFKQWGEYVPAPRGDCDHPSSDGARGPAHLLDRVDVWECSLCGRLHDLDFDFARVGKKAAGRLLDGREWSEFPAS
jgi:protein gp37